MKIKRTFMYLFNTLRQLAAFIGLSNLLLDNVKQSIVLGLIIALFWWKLDKNL